MTVLDSVITFIVRIAVLTVKSVVSHPDIRPCFSIAKFNAENISNGQKNISYDQKINQFHKLKTRAADAVGRKFASILHAFCACFIGLQFVFANDVEGHSFCMHWRINYLVMNAAY